jgi:integrase
VKPQIRPYDAVFGTDRADGRTEEAELIFTTSTGGPLWRSTFNDAFNRACELGKVARKTGEGFHRLRHTYASLLIKQNVSPKKIQVRLGHTSITETMDTYGHLYEDDDDAMREAIETALARVIAPATDTKVTRSGS